MTSEQKGVDVDVRGRLRWKQRPRETGLRSIGARPRGWDLHDGVDEYATVYPNGGGWQSQQAGWFWVAFGEVPHKNTHDSPKAEASEAKAEAMAYVKKHLAERAP